MISISPFFLYELSDDVLHKLIDNTNKNSMYLDNNKFKAKNNIADPIKIQNMFNKYKTTGSIN
jgi:hypothetical protein